MLIRKAEQSDVPGLAETHIASWRAAYRGLMPDDIIDKHTVQSRSDSWAKTLSDPSQRTLGCIMGDRVLGFSNCGCSREEKAQPSDAEIMAIYVRPDHWRHGIGHTLCKKTIENL